ncbi:PAS domain S-box protein [Pararhodobacter sp.]|uniref:PAS domain S-box protein n=1 Tax=Pararhodobacter sp. TaxID=2127056 RepID=UPI002B0033C2|nr:PAS domain S-box protein [Pararhodobacter sp.]
MSGAPGLAADADLWPCGLAVLDGVRRIQQVNATLRDWLGLENDAPETLRFVDILSRAGRIYFETHLRPLLLMEGQFQEISMDLERRDGTRFGVFLNGRATFVDGQMVSAHICLFQNQQRHAFELELVARRRESDEYKSLVRSSPYAIVSVNSDRQILAWNPAAERLFGFTEAEALGERFDQLVIPPEDVDSVPGDLRRVAAGEIIRSEAERLHKTGTRLQVERSIAAVHDKSQGYSGFVVVYSDISARKATEAQIQTLLREINHRSKNLLSVVQVIAQQTGRLYQGDEFLAGFNKRLASLSSNQDVLIRSRGKDIDLETLARAQVAHLLDPNDAQISLGGPPVQLQESVSQAIGMAFFELATNAAKYGALSQDCGKVTLTWQITHGPDPALEISWLETDGPPVAPPRREGFGYQVTGPILEGTTSGETRHDYAPDGFRWTLRAPLDQVTP